MPNQYTKKKNLSQEEKPTVPMGIMVPLNEKIRSLMLKREDAKERSQKAMETCLAAGKNLEDVRHELHILNSEISREVDIFLLNK